MEEVVPMRTLAEDQPVAALPGGDALAQMRTQAGQPGAVADQDQRTVVLRAMEGRIDPHPQVDLLARRGMQAQPAGTDAGPAIGLVHQPHHQFQATIGRQRGNRIGTVRQGFQAGEQVRAGQAAQGLQRCGLVRQQAAGERRSQR
jgi:hypothetical protein